MKKTNKGFSLVELIIVIAIMAILAGALAPALIKYINKSRLSTDVSNGQQIASAIQTALSNEIAYDSCNDNNGAITEWASFVNTVNTGNAFASEVTNILGDVTTGSAKSKKDSAGNALDQNYYVVVDVTSNVVEVYCGSNGTNASWMVYPTAGAGFVTK